MYANNNSGWFAILFSERGYLRPNRCFDENKKTYFVIKIKLDVFGTNQADVNLYIIISITVERSAGEC
jgi:hypothetical protein